VGANASPLTRGDGEREGKVEGEGPGQSGIGVVGADVLVGEVSLEGHKTCGGKECNVTGQGSGDSLFANTGGVWRSRK